MPGIVNLVRNISSELSSRLVDGNYPDLVDGYILLGREHIYEVSGVPRIVFIPKSSEFSAKDVSSNYSNSSETSLQRQYRSILTENKIFEVHIWAAYYTESGELDIDNSFDLVESYYQALIASIHKLCVGSYVIGSGVWADQVQSSSQINKLGHEYVFTVKIGTPVLDKLLPYAPIDVKPSINSSIIVDGNIETGCSIS